MLVRFSVKNFRSFRDEQVFSFEGGRGSKGERGRSFRTTFKSVPQLLHAAVIYGANSGGKSNLVRAMYMLQQFVTDSARSGQVGDLINVEPYRLDRETADKPSEFEIVFIHDGSLFQFGFAADENRIHAEWLYETPNDGRVRHLYSRELKVKSLDYDWYVNPRVRGEKKVWQEATRENALFLSTAVQLNSEDLSRPFDWIRKKFRVIPGKELLGDSYTAHVCHAHDRKSAVLSILRSVDPDVRDLATTEEEFRDNLVPDEIPDDVKIEIIKQMKGKTLYETQIIRKSRQGEMIAFDLDDESAGTNLLYSLSGPFLDTLCFGYTLVIDELDSGLHPLALRALVSMFFDPTQNVSDAQLLITCHESTLLRDDLLRPDQIWFLDKSRNGSKLYPLSQFRPRQNESFFKGYLGGRYGGLPITSTLG